MEFEEELVKRAKVVAVGDSESGKTALLRFVAQGHFPEEYEPTVFESYSTEVEIDKGKVQLSLWDTSGHSDYDHVRPLSYSDTDIWLLCFDIGKPESLENISKKWMQEIEEFHVGKPLLLVGCKSDVRQDINIITELAKTRRIPVPQSQGEKVAKELGADLYIQCSAKNEDISEVIDSVTLAALGKPLHKRSGRKKLFQRQNNQSKGACSIL